MLIKRVVIQGFKTFAKRTEFIFDPGVTAIVGPNGSGKSNIVDAIRWCLGEQSFSLLRSKKTSDVIFSGSDHKARLGMAQVSLTLDNNAGDLPIDFAEIEITRRAYRDGDNEYLINGQRVRLQDITDLLAQTGLGRRTYALIGQGLIDKILTLAPEELRGLFEEAAGITGYQAKRTLTIRRLDAAQQNLTRVQDILGELTPRLGYLRKQAERAREREQLAADLRNLLRDWYGYHWHKTLHDLDRQHSVVAQLQGRVEADQQALSQFAQQIEALRSQGAALRGQLGELHRDSSRLHREADQVGREVAVSQERLRQLQARQEEAHRELAPLRLQQESAAGRLDELRQQGSAAEAESKTHQAAVSAIQAQVDTRQQTRHACQEELAATRRTLETQQAAYAATASRRRQLGERRATLTSEEIGQSQAQAAASQAATQLAQTLAQHQAALAALEAQARDLQQQIAAREQQRSALRQQLTASQQTHQQAERTLDRLQTRHDLLTRLQQEGAGYASGVRAILQAARAPDKRDDKRGKSPTTPLNSPLNGILGTVASLIRVPATLDKAIETALGGAFQNIITQRWADTQAAIDYLKRSGNGRATFLPLDRLSVLPAIAAPKLPGVLGNALDLVEVDPQVRAAAEQLLNRVWVVDTLATARTALDSLRGSSRPTVVTLDGEIVRPGGAVTGGSEGSRRDDSILARERELRELPVQIQQAQATVNITLAQIKAQTAANDELGKQLTHAQEELTALARQERERRSQSDESRRQLDRAQQTTAWHTGRATAIAQELTDLDSQAIALDRELQTITAAQAQAQAALHDAESALQAADADDLLRQLADLRAAAAATHATWQNQQSLVANQQRSLQQTQQQISAKEQQIAALQQEETTLTTQLQALGQREEVLRAAIAALQIQLDPGEQQLARWGDAQADLEQQERQRQDTLRRNESAWNAAQLHFQRTDDALRQLRHDIESDLGLVLLEIGQDLAYQPPLPWDAVVEQLQPRTDLAHGLEDEIRELRARLSRVNNVNLEAPREYAAAAGRHEYLLTQSADLEAAIGDLRKIIRELDEVMETELSRTFAAVSEQFVGFFQKLFNGGSAKLVLADPDDITNSGIEIIARPPGKRPQSLALLSGGERTLAALALIFAILRVSPTPFCVLDEVDAALDEANVDRFRLTLEDLCTDTQFILITHNRRTLEGTNAIYGVTMSSDGTSRVISLRLNGDKIMRQDDPSPNNSEGNSNGDTADADVAVIEELVKM